MMGFSFCWDYRDCHEECSAREQQVLFCWRSHYDQDLQAPRSCDGCDYRRKWLSGAFSVRHFVAHHERRALPRTVKRVLAVDSDPHVLFALEDLVGYLGYECLTAANGEDGLILAEETGPDLIVTDLLLPRLDGFQLCRRIQQNPRTRHIPIIIVTTRNRQKDAEAVRTLGALACLDKPFRSSELADHIERALSTAHTMT